MPVSVFFSDHAVKPPAHSSHLHISNHLINILPFHPSADNKHKLWNIPLDYQSRLAVSSLFYTSAYCCIQKLIFKACIE